MNKLGAPVDNALLAAKLAPRLELVALQQGQVATDAAAGPVVQVSPVVNDVRLPSHLALERQLPAGVPAAAAQGEAAAAAPGAARLSAAARLIGALLAELPDAGPVRAALPVWPAAQKPPAGAALAGALAQAVDRSGLFYESHLVQFAAGARTLAQMAQEPQARWAPALPARGDAGPAAVAQAVASAPEPARPGVPAAAMPAPSWPIPAEQAPEASRADGAVPAVPRPPQAGPALAVPEMPPPRPGTADALPASDAQRVRAAYRAGEAAPSVASFEAAPDPRTETQLARHGASAAAPGAAAAPQSGAELIHPQTATVVHQQLDLLATAMFRWTGQAWPEVPMDWSIQEEGARQGDAAQEPAPRRWSTTLSLELPRLGAVELRLSLAGTEVQAQFAASEAATAGRMRSQGAALEQRFEAAGLRLQALQVSEGGGT
ncbi:hypothetical protein C7T35_34800 [Variovorax sp. WS11]|uniref:flagellar hook-length control protein FliK n=1 Tax=Variovorax sp. WS11 TaxID=1105204 RepID=UPI000D0E10D3|nr:flagellar hook-length control protein FliK [Variovorax sp. WS11]NDZ15820.1 hypothetical protein [Variovorax sp. WS11]PSL79981.1 hypothetical protein C7T35_34800 [Variovorax sp. WS11]